MDIGSALTDMWSSVLNFVPKAIGFLAIMFVGWIVARIVRTLIMKLLQWVKFDRVVERGGIARAFSGSKYTPASIIGTLGYYAVLLLTLQLAFGIFGANPVSDLIRGIVAWLPKLVVAIVIVVVAAAIANAVRDLISNSLSGMSYGRTLANIAWALILGLGVIAALNQIGVATAITTPILVAVLGTIAGIAIVGVGGGLIKPMQQRWERMLNKAEQESSTIREHVQANAAGRRDAEKAFSTQAQTAKDQLSR